ncbi:hypothetical protein AAHE18_20G093400 [Arachis hypogaea]
MNKKMNKIMNSKMTVFNKLHSIQYSQYSMFSIYHSTHRLRGGRAVTETQRRHTHRERERERERARTEETANELPNDGDGCGGCVSRCGCVGLPLYPFIF